MHTCPTCKQDTRKDITMYSGNELSLIVFNDQGLYEDRHGKWFISTLDELFVYTEEQLDILKDDLVEDLKEEE
jgi:hypothetical protein